MVHEKYYPGVHLGAGGFYQLTLHNCASWERPEDLIEALVMLQSHLGLVALDSFASVQISEKGEKFFKVLELKNFIDFCKEKMRFGPGDWNENYYSMNASDRLEGLWFRPAFIDKRAEFIQISDDLRISMHASRFGNDYNEVTFRTELGEGFGERPDVKERIEKITGLYVQMARALLPELNPEYIWIAEDDEYYPNVSAKDVLDRKIPIIYWGNYYSNDFLTKTARRIFLEAPVGIVEDLQTGIWFQLREDFEKVSYQEVIQIEETVMEHFASLRTLGIQWRFFIP